MTRTRSSSSGSSSPSSSLSRRWLFAAVTVLLACLCSPSTISISIPVSAQSLSATYIPALPTTVKVKTSIPTITVTPPGLTYYTIAIQTATNVNTLTATTPAVLLGSTNSSANVFSGLQISRPGIYTLNITGYQVVTNTSTNTFTTPGNCTLSNGTILALGLSPDTLCLANSTCVIAEQAQFNSTCTNSTSVNVTTSTSVTLVNGSLITPPITVNPGDANQLVLLDGPGLNSQPTTYATGSQMSLRVVVADSDGNPALTGSGVTWPLSVIFTGIPMSNTPGGIPLPGITDYRLYWNPLPTAAFNYSSPSVGVVNPGTYTTLVKGIPRPGVPETLSISATVSPTAPALSLQSQSLMIVVTDVSSASLDRITSGVINTPTTITVRLLDQFGNFFPTSPPAAPVPVTMTATNPAGNTPLTIPASTAANGYASFPELTFPFDGTWTLNVSVPSSGKSFILSFPIDATPTLTLTPPALAISPSPAGQPVVMVNQVLPSFTVRVKYGNLDTNPARGMVIALTTTNANRNVLAGTLQATTDSNGVATFNNVSFAVPASFAYVVRAAPATGPAATGDSQSTFSALVMTNVPASTAFTTTGNLGTVAAGSSFSVTLTLGAKDPRVNNGNTVVPSGMDQQVTIALQDQDVATAGAKLTGITTRTTTLGVVTFDGLAIDRVLPSGTYRVLAWFGPDTSTEVAKVTIISSSLATVTLAQDLPYSIPSTYYFPVTVTLRDSVGNPLSLANPLYATNLVISLARTGTNTPINDTNVFKCYTKPDFQLAGPLLDNIKSADCGAFTPINAVSNQVTFNVAVYAIGTYNLTVTTANAVNGSNTGVVSVTTPSFQVTVGPVYTLQFVNPPVMNATAGVSVPGVTLRVLDGGNQRVWNYTWDVTCTVVESDDGGINQVSPNIINRLSSDIIVPVTLGEASLGQQVVMTKAVYTSAGVPAWVQPTNTLAYIMCEAPFVATVFSAAFPIYPAPAPYSPQYSGADMPAPSDLTDGGIRAGSWFSMSYRLYDRFGNFAFNHLNLTADLMLTNQWGNQTITTVAVAGNIKQMSFQQGQVTFDSIRITTPGIYAFNAVAGTNFTAPVTSDSFRIVGAFPASLNWTALPSSSWLVNNVSRPYTLTAYDVYGNVASLYPGTAVLGLRVVNATSGVVGSDATGVSLAADGSSVIGSGLSVTKGDGESHQAIFNMPQPRINTPCANCRLQPVVSPGLVVPPLSSVVGRYVVVYQTLNQLTNGDNPCINLAELEVYSAVTGRNVALTGVMDISDQYTDEPFPKTNLNNGIINDVAHTTCNVISPYTFPLIIQGVNITQVQYQWLMLDLGQDIPIAAIVVQNRRDCCQQRTRETGTQVLVLNSAKLTTPVYTSTTLTADLTQVLGNSAAMTLANSGPLNVALGSASKIQFVTQPSNTVSRQWMSSNVSVQFLDAADNVIMVPNGTVVTLWLITNATDPNSFAMTRDGKVGIQVDGPQTATTIDGVATWSGPLRINVSGDYYLLAKSDSPALFGVSAGFHIDGGYPVRVAFSSQPSANVTNSSYPLAGVRLALYDELGNIAGTWLRYHWTVALTSYDAVDSNIWTRDTSRSPAPLLQPSSPNVITADNVPSLDSVTFDVDPDSMYAMNPAPMYDIRATVDVDMSSTSRYSISGAYSLVAHSTPFTVINDDQPTRMVIRKEPATYEQYYPGQVFNPIVLRVFNRQNNPPVRPVTVTVSLQDYSAVSVKAYNAAQFSGETEVQTDVNGYATFANLAITMPGFYTLTFSCPYESSIVPQVSTMVDVVDSKPGVVRKMVVVSQPLHGISQIGIEPIIVQLQDAFGKVVTSESSRSIVVHFNRDLSTPLGNAMFTAGELVGVATTAATVDTIRFTAQNGIVVIAGITLDLAGGYTFNLTSHGLPTVTTNTITIDAGEPVRIQWVDDPRKISPFQSFNTSCRLYDEMNNVVLNYNGPLQLLINRTESSILSYTRQSLPNGVIQFTYSMTQLVLGRHMMSIEALGLQSDRTQRLSITNYPAKQMKWVVNPLGPQFNETVPLRAGRKFSASVYVTNWLDQWDSSFTIVADLIVYNYTGNGQPTLFVDYSQNDPMTPADRTKSASMVAANQYVVPDSALTIINGTYTISNLWIDKVSLVQLRFNISQPQYPTIAPVTIVTDMFRVLPENVNTIEYTQDFHAIVTAMTPFNVTGRLLDRFNNVYNISDMNWQWHLGVGVCGNSGTDVTKYDQCGGASPFAAVGYPSPSADKFQGAAPAGTLGTDMIVSARGGYVQFTNLMFRSPGLTGRFVLELDGYRETINPNSYQVMVRKLIQVNPVSSAPVSSNVATAEITQQPAGPAPGTPNITCVVVLRDPSGALAVTAPGINMTVSLVILSTLSNQTMLTGTLTRSTTTRYVDSTGIVNVVNGIATFNDLQVSTFGTYRLNITFVIPGLHINHVLSDPFDVRPSQVVLTPVSGSSLATTVTSQQIIPPFSVSVQDTFGNIQTNLDPVQYTVSLQPVVLPLSLTNPAQLRGESFKLLSGPSKRLANNVTGTATFDGLSINQAGIYQYQVIASFPYQGATVRLAYTVPLNITVTPTAPARVFIGNLKVSNTNYRSISFTLQLQDIMFNNVSQSRVIAVSLQNSGHWLNIRSVTLDGSGFANVTDAVVDKCVPFSSTFNLMAGDGDIIPSTQLFTITNPVPGQTSCPVAAASSSSGLSTGAIAGIIVGSVIGFILLVAIIVFVCASRGGAKQFSDFISRKTKRTSTIPMTEMSKQL